MAINGLLDYGGLYNNYRPVSIPQVDVNEVKAAEEKKAAEAVAPASTPVAETSVIDNRSRMANLDDISLNFNSKDDYSYIGSDSDLGMLDMNKLISDMKKDKILEDYQYFVGSSQNMATQAANEDGMVFLKY